MTKIITKERAAYWHTTIRAMQKLIAANAPVTDDRQMVAWFDRHPAASQKKFAAPFVRRIAETRARLLGDATSKPASATDGAGITDSEYLAGLKRLRDAEYIKLRTASDDRDALAVADCTRQLESLSGLVAAEELRAFKLGREMGEVMQRSDVEGFTRSEKWWRLRCVDNAVKTLTPALIAAAAQGPLNRDVVVGILEPALLDATLARPMEQALRGKGMALPEWFVAIQREALGDLIEPEPIPSSAQD